jgi:uncharacterized repeat protein (TIGR01451 family)
MSKRVGLNHRWPLFASLGVGLLMALALIVASRVLPASAQSWSDVTISKTASPVNVSPNQEVTYSVTFTNSGSIAYNMVMSDIIPFGVTYVPGSLTPLNPSTSFLTGPDRVQWSGSLPAGQTVVVTFRVRVDEPQTLGPLPIWNAACVRFSSGPFTTRRCTNMVWIYSSRHVTYLPIVMRNYDGTPTWPWVRSGLPR